MTTANPSEVTLKLEARSASHARSIVTARDVSVSIDEPMARGGTNTGLTPTESLIASLIGCANVVIHRLAHRDGVKISALEIDAAAQFDRRGVSLEEAIETPFPSVTLNIRIAADATPEQLAALQRDYPRFCPVATVMRAAGADVAERWSTL